jgi:aryl-alcohol dehydrogenase-like predicted oxidoreductase
VTSRHTPATLKSETILKSGKPAIGLGCATFGREIDEATAFAIMDYAVEHGITFFDTAEAYGGGQAREYRRTQLGVSDEREVSGEEHSSEKIIGRWLTARKCRDRIVLASKVTRNFTHEALRRSLEASLKRLQTDRLDFYFFHRFDPAIPFFESLSAMDAVIKAGLAEASGCSNFTAQQMMDALTVCRENRLKSPIAIEVPYNLVQRDIESELLPLAVARKLRVIAYSPLAAGFLSGKYSPDRATLPKGTRFDVIPGHMDVYFSPQNFALVTRLHQFAAQAGVAPLELAAAWAFQQPAIDTVLVGARTTQHLTAALKARELAFLPEWHAEITRWK